MIEKPHPDAVWGETLVEMGAPFSLEGLMSNLFSLLLEAKHFRGSRF